MRLALPKALIQSAVSVEEAKLSIEHLISAIDNVRKSQREVGSSTDTSGKRKFAAQEALIAKKLLGTTDKSLDKEKLIEQ